MTTNPCLDLPSCVWIIFEENPDHFTLKCPWNQRLLQSFEWEALDKRWNPENKTWRIHSDCFYDVIELMKEYY